MDIHAEINKLSYKPFLCRNLNIVNINDLANGISTNSSFLLQIDPQNQYAVSWWVSAKRTRSYPYARVYDTLSFSGKKVTIIPIYKDEGADGDRDFLQWDTLSLMSLLQVNVIIGYYNSAVKSTRYDNKITEQRFDIDYIKDQITHLSSFQSDALHWNLLQADLAPAIAHKAVDAYARISAAVGVQMHSTRTISNKIEQISLSADEFKRISRHRAHSAQTREIATLQPKEKINCDEKASITINNYLGGEYYFTADEARTNNGDLFLVECKHSETAVLPSISDIKDGLIKMILFTNLENVFIGNKKYNPKPILKLTSNSRSSVDFVNNGDFKALLLEAKTNNFDIVLD